MILQKLFISTYKAFIRFLKYLGFVLFLMSYDVFFAMSIIFLLTNIRQVVLHISNVLNIHSLDFKKKVVSSLLKLEWKFCKSSFTCLKQEAITILF